MSGAETGVRAGIGRVLIIAGSDSGGGAGIQADIKTVIALGGYAATAITALTAQDTLGVHGVMAVPAAFVVHQARVVLDDIGADSIKIGMVNQIDVIEALAVLLAPSALTIPVVLDPVMVAKGGSPLLDPAAIGCLTSCLIPRAAVITPNLPEAALLTHRTIETVDDMHRAADTLLALGSQAVLLKGGHLSGDIVTDLLVTAAGTVQFESPRFLSVHTHGTGCTLASAVATGLAQGLSLRDAVDRGRRYVQEAIRTAPGLGHGHGPLNHGHTVTSFR
ncbi:MAG: bifunctional hydroxymethylpyrimidine kinase/phosphomethylpyrimidine kinase [Azospirillaceae bacterium]|nr:bifunctional hydroxymethylpyrimidine kinase/phosphomethylpyrimidine kinase [Azospirillaceae bacterium]